MSANLCNVVYLGAVSCMSWTVEADTGSDELGGILVGRRHVDVEASRSALLGERAHHVVRLEAVHANDRYAQSLGQLEGVGNRRRKILRHLLALGLVGRIRLVAEGRPARIHCQNGVGRTLLLEYGHQSIRKTNQRGGVYAARRHARVSQEYEMSLVEERHQVDYEELLVRHLMGIGFRESVRRVCRPSSSSCSPCSTARSCRGWTCRRARRESRGRG